jgi:hypothetical protein
MPSLTVEEAEKLTPKECYKHVVFPVIHDSESLESLIDEIMLIVKDGLKILSISFMKKSKKTGQAFINYLRHDNNTIGIKTISYFLTCYKPKYHESESFIFNSQK